MRFWHRLAGVTDGDEETAGRRNPIEYLVIAAWRSGLRLMANHCIIPSLRVQLLRWSGLQIGKRTQVNLNCNFIDGFEPGLIILEDEVAVAPGVSFVAESHPNNSILHRQYHLGKKGPIRIKRGAWLGVGVVVMPGITIGEASIVGANAVVTQDVEDYAIVVGLPAKKIGDVRETKSE